jgi:hypothetical protein
MSRYDLYDPVSGGFRAPLAVAITSADIGKIQAVSIAAGTGLVTIGGAAETAVSGVICAHKAFSAGDMIDVMTAGQITNATKTGGTAWAAGDIVYAHGTTGGVGVVDAVATAGKVIGKVIELDRVIIRVPPATT